MKKILKLKAKKQWYVFMAHPKVQTVHSKTVGSKQRKRLTLTATIAVAILLAFATFYTLQPTVYALEKLLGANDLLLGKTQYGEVQLSNDRTTLSLQRGSVGSWDQSTTTNLQLLPSQVYGSTAMDYGPNQSIYYISNFSNTCTFNRYDVERREWLALDSVPIGCSSGANLVYNGSDAFYYMPGGNTSYLFRYDISTDSWKRLSDMPTQVGGISNADFVNRLGVKSVFVFRGGGSASFWKYDVASDSWTSVSPFPTTGSVSEGIALSWDGADTIYALVNHTGEFKKYSIASNSWTSLATYSLSHRRSTLTYANGVIYASSVRTNTEETFIHTYDTTTQVWTAYESPSPATTRDWPSPIAYDGSRYIYTQVGTDYRQQMYRFDTTTNSWNGTALFTLSGGDDWHHSLIYDGNKTAYYAAGYESNNFRSIYQYDLTTKKSQQIGAQFGTSNGFKGVYYGGALYLTSNNNASFQKFDISTGTFTTLADAPYTSTWGADIIDGGDGYLYATFGGRTNFHRYHIASNTWQSRASLINSSIGTGGGISRIGRTIYAQHGSGTGFFSSYNMDTNSWSSKGNLPNGKVDHGGWIASDGNRYIYVGPGTRTDEHNRRFFRYDTVSSEWLRMADLPASADISANAFYDTTNSKLYVSQGWASSNLWQWSPNNNTYVQNGAWYSKSIHLKQVQSWGNLEANIGGVGTATIYTRTSLNGRLWTEWQAVSGTTINSPPNRYIQLKITMTGSGSQTPTVSNLKINYNQETTPPTVPSQFTARSERGGDILTSGQNYEWQHPYFSWDGASDGTNGAGIKGYYVYFGKNSGADPVTEGSFQKTTNYTVTAPMQAGDVYYVRIKVIDNLDNVSSAATFFSYRYFYISPPGTQTKTSDADFFAGTNTNVSIQNGSMSLKHSDEGRWSTGSVEPLPEKARASASVVIDEYMYTMRGINTTTFWRYNLITRTWETLAPSPDTAYYGSSLTWDGNNYIYALRGNNSNDFYRYDIQDNIWETLPVLPAIAQRGSDISYIGNNTIALFYAGVREFYMYNVKNKTFTVKESYPNAVSYAGSGIWFDGNDSIYAYLGGHNWWNTSDNTREMLVKYTISTDSWKALGQPPVGAVYTQNNLVGDGHGGLYIFSSSEYNNTSKNQLMLKYDIEADTWSEIEGLNSQVNFGSATTDNERFLYIMPSQAGNSTMLVRYDTWDKIFSPSTKGIDKWERMAWDWPSNAWNWHSHNSTAAAYDGSQYIYALGRSESAWSQFIRFDPRTGETKYLPPPHYVSIGDSLAFINGELYYSRAGSSTDLYKFDMLNEQWVQMSDVPASVYRPGAGSLIGVGSTGLLVRGNSNYFYQYTPGANGGNWTRKADIPGSVLNGSALYDEASGSIYVIRGNNTNNFYKYDIVGDSWSTLSSLPQSTTYGSSMTLNSGKIYAARGNNTNDMFVYDIASNNWSSSSITTPDSTHYNSAFIKIDSERAIFLPSNNSPDIWHFIFPSETTAYQGYAEHQSEIFTVSGMFDYAGIEASVDIPSNTKIEFWTRSSDDSTNWDEWVIADQAKYYNGRMSVQATSQPKKYTQIKIKLYSHDNVYTPKVNDYKLQYYFDIDPPNNPTTIEVYSDDTKNETIDSNTWYNYSSPTFDWPEPGEPGGPTDGPLGSNMRGYWVYLGTDETAVPRTAGVFVKDATEFTPKLTNSGTYFFRLQAEDMTGNVDSNIYAPFNYKFDNTPPSSPSLITVTPGGYTTMNNYTFDWPASFDSHSGISGYCYHTGATSGPFATEICQPERRLPDISAAYRTGTNVFYLRTLDNAGNYSTAYTTVSYYYTTDPPSPPTNLRAIPPNSTQNLFAFTWDLPSLYSGDPDQLSYCYSINILPSALNTTCVDNRFISPYKAATQKGTNIIYMVTKDEAGNVSWTNYTSAIFIANTVSPGLPLNLVVNDTSDQAAKRWSLTATWDPPTFEGNGVAAYILERSADGHTFEEIGNTSTTAFVDLNVAPNKAYYYRVRAADNVDNRGGPSGAVSGTPKGSFSTPPSIVVNPSASADATQAAVRWVTNRKSSSFVYYGTSPTDLGQSKGSLESVTDHDQTITGLLPSTTYYYRVQSFDSERSYQLNDAFSQIYTFRTTDSARIYDVATDSVTLNSAILSWQTSVPTKTRIEYGPDLSYTNVADNEDKTFGTNHIFKLSDLDSGTLYHFRIVSKTQFGSTLYSDDYTVKTIARPIISNIRFQPLEDEATTAVKITWNTNVPATSTIRYRGLGVSNESSQSKLTTEHSTIIRDLAGSTEYTFNVEGRDAYGNLTTSEDQTWQSGYDTRTPTISDMNVSMTTTKSSNNTRAQVIVSWKTDEPATSQVTYQIADADDDTQKETPLDTEPTTSHVVVISDLGLADIYKIKVASRDLSGNTAYGAPTSIVTPDEETNVLDSVLTILERIFRF